MPTRQVYVTQAEQAKAHKLEARLKQLGLPSLSAQVRALINKLYKREFEQPAKLRMLEVDARQLLDKIKGE